MTKKLSSLLLGLVFSFCAWGQVSFGIRTGANLNFVSLQTDDLGNRNLDNYKMENNLGAYCGGFVKLPFSDKLSFKPGIDMMVRGAGRSERERLSIYYLDLPLSFQYQITEKFYLDVGPVASVRIAARAYAFSLQKRINVSPSVEQFNIGLSAGAGYFLMPRLGIHASFYRVLNKAWDVTFRDVNNMPDGSVSYFPGNISVGIEYYFKN